MPFIQAKCEEYVASSNHVDPWHQFEFVTSKWRRIAQGMNSNVYSLSPRNDMACKDRWGYVMYAKLR
jgi:hypothetical protein